VKNELEIIPVKWIDEVLEHALERMPEPLPEAAAPADVAAVAQPAEPAADNGGVVKR
jgi:ATP-dependent Lon protease